MGDYREKVRCILKLMIQANQLRVEFDTTSRNAKKDPWKMASWTRWCNHRVFSCNPIPALRNSMVFPRGWNHIWLGPWIGDLLNPVDQWTAPPASRSLWTSLQLYPWKKWLRTRKCTATCAVVNTLSKSSSIDHPLLQGKNLSFG